MERERFSSPVKKAHRTLAIIAIVLLMAVSAYFVIRYPLDASVKNLSQNTGGKGSGKTTTPTVTVTDPLDFDNVLIVVNDNSPESIEVGDYYASMRKIPAGRTVHLNTATSETITEAEYISQVQDPIKKFLETNSLKDKILSIVTTYGVPTRVKTNNQDCEGAEPWGCQSVDNKLAQMYKGMDYNPYALMVSNREFAHKFNHTAYPDMYLIMRLDGPSKKIAKGLVDKAMYSEKYTGPGKGIGYMSSQPSYWGSAETYNQGIEVQCGILEQAGYECKRDPFHLTSDGKGVTQKAPSETTFGERVNPLWFGGEHNYHWDYWKPWVAGAVAFNQRSYAAKFSIRNTDIPVPISVPLLLAADITATSGPVDEPYLQGVPSPSRFFNYFLNGEPRASVTHFTLAESFYLALSSFTEKVMFIGDPLYTLSNAPQNDTEKPLIANPSSKWDGDTLVINWDNTKSVNNSPEVTYGAVDWGTNNTYSGGTVWDETELIYWSKQKGAPVKKKNYLAQHEIRLSGLNPSITNYVKITATDPNNNTSTHELTISPR